MVKLYVLVGNADNLLISLAPITVHIFYLDFDHFCGVFLQLLQLALCKEFSHYQGALVLDKVGSDSLFLVLASLVH